jgi:hypothetical protein
MKNKIIEVTVSDSVFIDKEGKKLNAWKKPSYKWSKKF